MCWSCPAGTYASVGAAACSLCASGYFSEGAAAACAGSCSAGKTAVAQACVVPVTTQPDLEAAFAEGVAVQLKADIFLTKTITITGITGVTIDGQGLYRIDGQSRYRCFTIQSYAQVTLSGLTITHGYTEWNF